MAAPCFVPAALAQQPRSGSVILTLIGMLLAVAGVLVLAYLTTRWIGRRGARGLGAVGGSGGERLRVLCTVSLGQNERLALVRLGERCLLLGVASGQITLLRELDGEEAAAWLTEGESGAPAAPSFLDVLKKNLPKGK